MTDLDRDHLNGWLGRTTTARDTVTAGLVDRFRVTLGMQWLAEAEVPLGLHWCLAPDVAKRDALGPDGHPARGGFLPPAPGNRMWAGGALRFYRPLRIGDEVERASRVVSITSKSGRSGPLVFVAVEHALTVGGELRIEERHDIVYCPARPAPETPPDPLTPETPTEGGWVGDPVTLQRYSAVTFNGHRIHYDYPYVTGVEGYGGLVVHGPLQATLLMNRAAQRAGRTDLTLRQRGLSPLLAGEAVTLREDGERFWVEKTDGTETYQITLGESMP